MTDLEADYRVILDREFKIRRERRKGFSLRAFARFLRIDPTFLSKLITGKVLLSLDTADKITRLLKLNTEERSIFLMSAAEEQKCHALYLIDPSLTECDEDKVETNKLPSPRKKPSNK